MRCFWNVTTHTLMILLFGALGHPLCAQLIVSGVVDGPLVGGTPKAVELYAAADIADLSLYGIGSANNGNGSNGVEFTFPPDSVKTGDFLYIAVEEFEFESFFGFFPDYTSGAMSINGDDAIELFREDVVIDVFGQIDVDGTGQAWEHTDGWTYRNSGTGPDGTTFVLDNWYFSGPDALDGEWTNDTAQTPVPFGSYVGGLAPVVVVSLHAGDADQDLDFDQFDLIKVQVANKYLSGRPATWGEGDWDGAPGGRPGSPPEGNGFFDQMDIVSALNAGLYLTGPYSAHTGERCGDVPADKPLTSILFGSAAGSWGNIASAGSGRELVSNDLTVVGSLTGGGDLGEVDLIHVPEPTCAVLLGLGLAALLGTCGTRRTQFE